MSSIGLPGIILLVILALLLFGPKKLPELGRAIGRTFKEFKEGAQGIVNEQEPSASGGTQAVDVQKSVPASSTQSAQPAPSQTGASDNQRLPE